MKVSIDELRAVTRRAIAAQGFGPADAEVVLEIIMYAQLRGNNQNVIKLLGAGMPANPAAGEIKVVKETQLSALIDGDWNQGMVVLSRATRLAIDKARTSGFGIVGHAAHQLAHRRDWLLRALAGGARLDRLRLFRRARVDGHARFL